MIKTFRTALVVFLSFLVSFAAHAAADKQEAQALVEKAVAYAQTNGKDKLVTEVNKKNGPFHQGDLYVFVFDLDGTVIANPANPEVVGKNDIAKPDADGKLFRKDILNVAKTQGSGWVDYKWLNPTNGKVEPKTSYVKKQGDVIIGAGVYAK